MQLVFTIDLSTERSQLFVELSLLGDGKTKRLTIPFTGAAPGELAFTATLLGATPVHKLTQTRLREKMKTAATTGQTTVESTQLHATSTTAPVEALISSPAVAQFKRRCVVLHVLQRAAYRTITVPLRTLNAYLWQPNQSTATVCVWCRHLGCW